jgi:hypothetical protein
VLECRNEVGKYLDLSIFQILWLLEEDRELGEERSYVVHNEIITIMNHGILPY